MVGHPFAGLKELSRCVPSLSDPARDLDEIRVIAALTALTRLGLSGYKSWDSPSGLGNLPTTELRLRNCRHLELDLFVPDALQSLEALMISDAVWIRALTALLRVHPQPVHPLEPACKKAGKVLLQLPLLRRLEGISPVFTFGLGERSKELQTHVEDLGHTSTH